MDNRTILEKLDKAEKALFDARGLCYDIIKDLRRLKPNKKDTFIESPHYLGSMDKTKEEDR